MQCPRCGSERIQRDYDDPLIVLRLAGLRQLLCNNCGLVFKRFDPREKQVGAPSENARKARSLRRVPRYHVHLPAAISLIERKTRTGKASYSQPSWGHCETISKVGMALSLVGTRFAAEDLSRIGRLLFVRVDLPEGPIEAVVSIITHDRIGEEGKRKWMLGVNIQQMSDADSERLSCFLDERAQASPVILPE